MSYLYIHMAVQITEPNQEYLNAFTINEIEDFMFDEPGRFIIFTRAGDGPAIQLAKDDHGGWFFMTYFSSSTLTGLKWSRQSARPSYADKDVVLPFVELLKEEGVSVTPTGFDKAFAHVGAYFNNIAGLEPDLQARLANVDGEDDPTVVSNIHFVRNLFKGLETRYVAGAETKSFATISENEEYFKEIHLKTNAFLYLLYFIYFEKYRIIPSKQMVPRLLANLWASKQVLKNDCNPTLFISQSLTKKE